MATTFYSNTSGNYDDANLGSYNTTGDGVAARNVTTANTFNNSATTLTVSTSSFIFFSFNWRFVNRSTLSFDVSAEAGNVESATLRLCSGANTSGFSKFEWTRRTYICGVSSIGASWDTSDFNNLNGWVSSGSYDGNVREYADFANAQSTVFTIDLNANAITDINAAMTDNSEFHIMLLHENDFLNDTTLLNTPATTGGGAGNGDGGTFRSSEDASISLRPLLTVVYGEEEAAVTNNANFFGSNF
tara:strand:- start:170 stop:904 length:735 start_codon:yes stop_codon:yes gene_type:complete